MGIIIRQSIKNSIVNYIAAFIGAINVLVIYERLLEVEELGRLKFFLDTAAILVPFIVLGIPNVILRFYPKFKRLGYEKNILLPSLFVPVFGFIIYLILCFTFYKYLPDRFKEYFFIISAILFFKSLESVLSAYSNSNNRIVIPSILNGLWYKITIPIIVLMYAYEIISFESLESGALILYVVSTGILILYINRIAKVDWKLKLDFLSSENIKEIKPYALYSIFGPVTAVLVYNIDRYMVTEILNFEKGGIYTIAVYFTIIFTIPKTSILSISNSVISNLSDDKKNNVIHKIYQKSSINLLAVGFISFICLWMNLDDIFSLMSKGNIYKTGTIVILIVSMTNLIDMATSVNGIIIAHSKFYRFNLYSLLFLSILNIVFNLVFIRYYGMVGAAISTFISLTLYNIVKCMFVWIKLNSQPFTKNTFFLIALSVSIMFLYNLISIPITNVLIRIITNCIILCSFFGLGMYFMKISEDFNLLINQRLAFLRRI